MMDKLSRMVEALEQTECSDAKVASWRSEVEGKYQGRVEKRGRRYNLQRHLKNIVVDDNGQMRFK
jgi:hypothetical protein